MKRNECLRWVCDGILKLDEADLSFWLTVVIGELLDLELPQRARLEGSAAAKHSASLTDRIRPLLS